jgi:DNA modification methylase
LGTASEALGELNYSEMLTRFFKQMDLGKARNEMTQEIKEWEAGKQTRGNHFAKLSFRVSQSINQWKWKEPLTIRNRTMTKSLSHKSVTVDSTKCSIANADYLLIFRRSGKNPVPVIHPQGLTEYAGERQMPAEALEYRNWRGSQLENKFSHWIWRQYASAFWDDVRLDRVLKFKPAKDQDDDRHVHPLQLDVIDRALVLWSNPDETIFTPFMGVGSEIYSAIMNERKAIGVELKSTYYRQALRNIEATKYILKEEDQLFAV